MGRHALLLGTATYVADSRLPPLPPVRHDVAQLKALLDSRGEFDSVQQYLDLPVAQLRHVVEEFYGARRFHDFALLYYSGHGVLHEDGQSLFLAATDTAAGQLHATALDVDGMLRHLLNDTKATQKVVLLDCCFSGAFTARHRFRGGVREEPRRAKRERGTFVLTSSEHQKASKVDGPERPSIFTAVLLDGLRGAAQSTGDDGWITTNDLSRYALTEMARRGQHKPVESSEGVTDPIKLVAGANVSTAAGAPTATRVAPAATDDAAFDADQWRRLLTYYTSCLRRSTILQSFVDPDKSHLYLAAPAGREAIFTASAPVPLRGPGQKLAGLARDDGRTLQYGYPVIALKRGRWKKPVLAPLLVCDVSVGDDNVLHPRPLRPNPGLIDHFQLSAVEADELIQEVERTFTTGDAKALAATVDLVMKTFGLSPVSAIDPTALMKEARRTPLDSVQNAAILYVAGTTGSPEAGLVDDLAAIVKNPDLIGGTALGALADRVRPGDASLTVPVALGQMSEAQEDVIRAAMSQTLTVAQGPPGTGKSQLVAALLTTATAAGQSVLVGSTNNEAVNQVVDRITDAVGPGLVVRTGNRDYRQQEPEHLAAALRRYASPGRGRGSRERPHAHDLRLLAEDLIGLRESLDERRLLERDLADLAVERTQRGAGADTQLLPEDDQALVRLVALTDRALTSRWFGWYSRRRLRRYGVHGLEAIAALGERATIELRWRERRQRLAALPAAETTWQQMGELLRIKRPALSRQLLEAQLIRRVTGNAQLVRDRADEMAKPDGRSWTFFPQLLRALPAWATTTMSARSLPCRAGMFDLVIIDEATQCTVPAVLPLLYRARRALIIGDPRQLTPVVELPELEDQGERIRAGLSERWMTQRRLIYRSHSAYEAFAAMAKETYLLDEHYRCHPDIIDVPNRMVYQGRLTVLTDTSRLLASAEPAVRWVDVRGRYQRGVTGSGCNDEEAAAVVDEVRRLRAAHPDAEIGVVTPLAAQKQILERRLRAAGLDEHLLCNTIHRFQGSERDIMVASPVGAQGISEQTRGWLVHQTNLWNVALTRARSQLIIVGDRSWWSAQHGLLTVLATETDAPAVDPDAIVDAVDRLHRALNEAGLEVRREAVLAGYPVDLVVQDGGPALALVVDDPAGDPDGRGLRKMLARLDVVAAQAAVRRIPAWRCLAEPDQVATELSRELKSRASQPGD